MGKTRAQLPHWADGLISAAVRSLIGIPAVAGPWPAVEGMAALGRWWGGLSLNRKRFSRALDNVRQAYPAWTDEQVEQCAKDSYQHLFRLVAEFLYTPRLFSDDAWATHFEIPRDLRPHPDIGPSRVIDIYDVNADAFGSTGTAGAGPALDIMLGGRRCVMVTAHCGNWELLAYTLAVVGFPTHALYRPLDNRALDSWVRSTRERRGMTLLDKFGAAERVTNVMRAGYPLGFVADQNAGDRGLFVPYFGRLASTYKAVGLMAIEHQAPVLCATARRLPGSVAKDFGAGFRYRIEVTDVIEPESWKGHPDPLFYLTARYRRAIEKMVHTAPEQYLWMHRMWKSRPRHERLGKPFPRALIEKMRTLPWMTEAEIARIVEDSERSSREFASTQPVSENL